jgi:uncharacterized protein
VSAHAAGAPAAAPTPPRPLAVVTGASAGIGRSFCEALAAEGYDLLAVARDAGRLGALATELGRRHAAAVEPLAADLSRDADVDRVVARVAAARGLALLVNNAGFGTRGPLAETDPRAQEAMVRLHALAPLRLIQAALPPLLRRGAGAIVNVSSVAGFFAAPGSANYCATKAYLTTLTRGLAAELAGTAVRVQALCPGFTRSEFHVRAGMTDDGRTPRWLWLDADRVVADSLAALRRGGPVVVIPGRRYRAIVAGLRLVPGRLVGELARWRRRGV